MSIIWHCLYRESRKIIKMNLLIKQKDSQKEKTNTWLPKGKWGRDKLVVWDLHIYIAAAAKSLQSCPTLSDSMDCSLPGFSIHGIFQARVLEWGATAFSDIGLVQLYLTPWIQCPLVVKQLRDVMKLELGFWLWAVLIEQWFVLYLPLWISQSTIPPSPSLDFIIIYHYC